MKGDVGAESDLRFQSKSNIIDFKRTAMLKNQSQI
jgi:hypothetical protein